MAVVYAYAMLGALAGAVVAYAIVSGVPAIVLECPECSGPFTPNLEKASNRHRCPGCKAALSVSGDTVTVAARRKALVLPGSRGKQNGRPVDRPTDAPGSGAPPA
ncbi:MAG: hypothetical protein ACYTKD_22055 [Planctomycetota bacterium]|jgi:hypothetical protein